MNRTGEKMNELLHAYPLTIEIPVAWGEMDVFQHVNNVVYFKYFQSARIAYFEKLKFDKIMQETGIAPMLASTQCRYKIQLTYPDRVTVGARVDAIEEDRFTMKHVVVSHKHEKAAALGESVSMTFDFQKNKKVCVPDDIRQRILDFEKSAE